jgi:cytochrome P450
MRKKDKFAGMVTVCVTGAHGAGFLMSCCLAGGASLWLELPLSAAGKASTVACAAASDLYLQDVEVAGYAVRKGQTVVANVYAMQRHPEIWQQPNTWLPQRWLPEGAAQGLAPKAKNAFLPFSTGARSCMGRSYAMLQMVLTVAVLLGRGIRFKTEGSRELRLVKGLSMYAEDGVWLVPTVN